MTGGPEAPPVLLLHGFPDVASTFDGLAAELARAGFQAIAIQSRGHAPSVLEVPRTRTLFRVLAEDALAVADALVPGRRFGVVGHDNGAFATYALLALAPDRAVTAVTLTAAHPATVFANTSRVPRQMWRSRYAMLFQVPALSDWFVARNDFAYVTDLWRRWAAPGFRLPEAHLAEVKRTFRASWPGPLLHYRAMPFEGDPTPLSQPTLYLLGAEDGCVLPEVGRGQERHFRGPFESELVPGVGHFLHLESPERVLPRIVGWLERHGPRRSPASQPGVGEDRRPRA